MTDNVGGGPPGPAGSLGQAETLVQSVCDCFVKGTFLIHGSPSIECDLDTHAILRSLNAKDAVVCPAAMNRLHLCHATIHEQFRSRDVAAVVACEKHHGLGDLIGCTEPAERNSVGNHL